MGDLGWTNNQVLMMMTMMMTMMMMMVIMKVMMVMVVVMMMGPRLDQQPPGAAVPRGGVARGQRGRAGRVRRHGVLVTLGSILVLLSVAFASDKSDAEKSSAFECGFEPFDETKGRRARRR